ncbi:MAG: hypothetical protein RMX62_01130 [Planktomarina sp.]|nr:hypothetical protein [Planktomarina sp.]
MMASKPKTPRQLEDLSALQFKTKKIPVKFPINSQEQGKPALAK